MTNNGKKKIEYFLDRVCNEYCDDKLPEIQLYEDIANDQLRLIISTMHNRLNKLFSFMYAKASPKSNYHYNADQSRELLKWIDLFNKIEYELSNTELSISINDDYKFMMDQCKPFLMEVSGSTIPLDLIRIDLIEYEPIFYMNSFVKVTDINNSINYKTKLIDHGSYANVFKYRDEFYNRDIIIKRAKVNELNKKELERFKQEFEVMDKLNSPYVVSVYRYDDTKKEYFMECADETLKKYIDRNNTKIDNKKRFEIINQIIKALKYVHNKGYLHRDLSLSNVLLFHYDDVTVVKLSDFGLVKFEESDLTSINSDIKGSLNDPALIDDGFLNYSFEHEIYALTRLVLFVLTGKRNIQYLKDQRILDFVKNGTNPNKQLRFKDLDEFKKFVSKLII